MINDYEVIYLISNAVTTYAVFLFFKIFFGERNTSKSIEICSYIFMYLISSYLFIMGFTPKTIIIANITLLLLIAGNYKGEILQKIISPVLIYIIFWAVEMLVVLLTSNTELSLHKSTNYSSILGVVMIPSICIVLANIFRNFKNLKKGDNIPIIYWGLSIIIPLSSIYIGNIVFMSYKLTRVEMIVCTIWIFAINIGVVIIYDILKALMENIIHNIYSKEKLKYYQNEVALIKSSNDNINKVKYDLKNHIHSMSILLEDKKYKELNNYINNLELKVIKGTKLINTENTIIDGILNYKIQESKNKGIKMDVNMSIPENIEIDETEMTIALSNLLDNAMEAAERDKLNREINITGEYKKGNLDISIKNYFLESNIDKENLTTTKEDKKNHGLGLKSAREAVNKMKGRIHITINKDCFEVELVIPIKK